MPHSAKTKPHQKEVKRKEKLSDESLLDLVQRQTFLYFWDGARANERAGARSRRTAGGPTGRRRSHWRLRLWRDGHDRSLRARMGDAR